MALIWIHVGRVLRSGIDAIIEGGFWSRASRDDARRRAKEFDVIHKLYALNCPADEARRRVMARTAVMQPGTLEITGPTFDLLLRQLEPLGTDEEYVIAETSKQNSSS
jgi:predicted kinase